MTILKSLTFVQSSVYRHSKNIFIMYLNLYLKNKFLHDLILGFNLPFPYLLWFWHQHILKFLFHFYSHYLMVLMGEFFLVFSLFPLFTVLSVLYVLSVNYIPSRDGKAYKIAQAKLWVWKISTQKMSKNCPKSCKIRKNAQNCTNRSNTSIKTHEKNKN